MKIVYMGTPEFAVPALERLAGAGHEIVFVVTQRDAVSGRGRKIKYPPVKEKAIELGIPVLQPEKVRGDEKFSETLKEAAPDLIVAAAYGQILPVEILDIPSKGCLNVHGSLLPRFRGAAPIQRAIIEGDDETGVTIMYMEEGLDTGDMLAKASTPIGRKTGEELHDELAVMGAELLTDTIAHLDSIKAEKQRDEDATYAPMIRKEEGRVDFSTDPFRIERMIRAFDPWPGVYTYIGDRMIKIWKADPVDEPADAPSGTVLRTGVEGIDVSAGGRILRVRELQASGKKRMSAEVYLIGNSIEIGTVLG